MCMKRHNIMPWVLKRKKPIKTCRFCADAGFYYILSCCLGEVIEQGQDTDYKLKAFLNSINYPQYPSPREEMECQTRIWNSEHIVKQRSCGVGLQAKFNQQIGSMKSKLHRSSQVNFFAIFLIAFFTVKIPGLSSFTQNSNLLSFGEAFITQVPQSRPATTEAPSILLSPVCWAPTTHYGGQLYLFDFLTGRCMYVSW